MLKTLIIGLACLLACGCQHMPQTNYWEDSKTGIQKAGDAASKAPKRVYQAIKKGVDNTQEAVEDAWILSNLKTQYTLDDYIKAANINIDVSDGNIDLFGHVESAIIHERAVLYARSIKGAKQITSHLVIIRAL